MLRRQFRLLAMICFVIVCLSLIVGTLLIQPNHDVRNYWYWMKTGGKAAPFSLYGKVVDQYGVPISDYTLEFAHFLDGDISHTLPFKKEYCKTNVKGEFTFQSSVWSRCVILGTPPGQADSLGRFWERRAGEGGIFWSINRHFASSNGIKWIEDSRFPVHGIAVGDPQTPLIYHVGKMGPPERLMEYNRRTVPIPSKSYYTTWPGKEEKTPWLLRGEPTSYGSYACGLRVLTGEVVEGECKDCDIIFRLFDRKGESIQEGEPSWRMRIEAKNYAGVQLVEDPFWKEVPPEGYKKELDLSAYQNIEKNPLGAGKALLWRWGPQWAQGFSPSGGIYFFAKDKQVYGRLEMAVIRFYNEPEKFEVNFHVIANPRGSKNLNRGAGGVERPLISLPITLPFREDIPVVDRKKIWAYEDPQKENTIIIEGEKGAVEVGAGVTVINYSKLSNERAVSSRIKKWEDGMFVLPDGSFKLSLDGQEGDDISVSIGWLGGINPKTGNKKIAQGEGVELAPRWRLKSEKQ